MGGNRPVRQSKGRQAVTFLKKSNQKTFVLGAWVLETPRAEAQKFFAELFYKKATACFARQRQCFTAPP
jgi:hypothetical protein